ncbi:MAG: glycosyltransferase family 4 protein [Chloroflexi bacterium]|nr:glycosyltransferase family 4 protein [Chloroflexota bacterium]
MTAPRLIAIGPLHWTMGYDYLLAALSRLHQAGVPFTAQIVGSGPLYSDLRFAIGDIGLRDIVRLQPNFTPEQTTAALQEADVYVLTSHRDEIRPPLRDALALGKVVVAAAFPGIEQVVQNGINGYLTPPRDVYALADRLSQVLRSPDQHASTSDNPTGSPPAAAALNV